VEYEICLEILFGSLLAMIIHGVPRCPLSGNVVVDAKPVAISLL
jgi:hypothetical protein